MSSILLESSRLHLLLKHLIKLYERPVLRFRELEPKYDKRDHTCCREDETCLAQQSSTIRLGIEHVRRDNVPDAGP